MKRIYILLFFLCSIFVTSQTNKIDSLTALLDASPEDSVRLRLNATLSEICNETEIAKYADAAIKIGEKILSKNDLPPQKKKYILKLLGLAYTNSGFYHRLKGHTTFALDLYTRGLNIRELYRDTIDIAQSMINIATIYNNQGKVAKALSYYNKCLVMQQLVNDKAGIAISLNNMAAIYESQGQTEKTLGYWQQSLKIFTELNDKKGQILVLNNIGSAYVKLNQIDKGLNYLNNCLKIHEELGNTKQSAYTLENIGSVYFLNKQIKQAIETYNRSLTMRKKIDDQQGIASSYIALGEVYLFLKDYKKAEDFGLKSLRISQEIGYPKDITSVADLLYKTYKQQNKVADALKMHELFVKMRDSTANLETRSASIKSELQYIFDKKFIADSIKNLTERKITNAKIALQNAKIKQQNTLRYALIIGLILISAFLIFFYTRFRITKIQKNIIQSQNIITKRQKKELALKNKNITESILMAKEIQDIIFPSETELNKTFTQCFMLFKPCEILSGDFLWLKTIKEKTFLIIGDCAGHGVPASLLTVFANEFLNKIIVQRKIYKASEILSLVNEEIFNHIKRKIPNTQTLNEGMDIGICIIDKTNTTFTFCGARINLFYTNEQNNIAKIIGEKIYLGKELVTSNVFVEHVLPINSVNTIYLTTDGLSDQLKYKSNKVKFGFKGYENFITQNTHLSLNEQKNNLLTVFKEITAQHPQIDDILVFASKIA